MRTDAAAFDAPDGAFYAVADDSVGTEDSGPFTRFGGYSDQFVNGMTTGVKVFLDPTWDADEGFQYTVAINGANGNHLRDFAFLVRADDTEGLQVGIANGAGRNAITTPLTGPTQEVTEAGWYTFQHVFNNVGGVLSVDLNLVNDLTGLSVNVGTLTNPADTIGVGGVVGGNRYGWFTSIDVNGGLAVDTLSLRIAPNQAPTAVDNVLTAVAEDSGARNIAAAELLAGDTDPETGPLDLTTVGAAVGGTVSLSGGNVVFTPTANFNGPASFTYTVTDVEGATDTATASFTVTAVDETVPGGGSVTPPSTTPTAGPDNLTGTTGDDTTSAGTGNDTVAAGTGNDNVFGNEGNDQVFGNEGNDSVFGGQGNDSAFGGQGDDAVQGNLGNDSVEGNKGNDEVLGNQGSDTVLGNEGDDFVHGGQDSDFVHGGQGNDNVNGGLGNDTVNGGLGDDIVSGGAGTDVFVFATGQGDDTVTDFGMGDVLDLQGQSYTLVAGADGSAVLDLSGGGSITLTGVAFADFDDAFVA